MWYLDFNDCFLIRAAGDGEAGLGAVEQAEAVGDVGQAEVAAFSGFACSTAPRPASLFPAARVKKRSLRFMYRKLPKEPKRAREATGKPPGNPSLRILL